MKLDAVTFDFWSTLVDGEMTPARTLARMQYLQQALEQSGHVCTAEDLQTAFERAMRRLSESARETLEDVGPPGRWAAVARELGVPDGVIPFAVVEKAYEDLTFDPLPDPMPHVHTTLAGVREAGYRVGLICNTGMAGGQVLREVLRRHELLQHFDVTVFSNEFGTSKPHPSIFQHTLEALGGVAADRALHIGDMEELDVEGARRAGIHSARYMAFAEGPVDTDADLLITDWRQFLPTLAAFERSLP